MSNATHPQDKPGLPCPGCAHPIRLSLETIRAGTEVRCPACGLSLTLDQSKSSRLVELLQDLDVAQKHLTAHASSRRRSS